jgi:hypothetical protein
MTSLTRKRKPAEVGRGDINAGNESATAKTFHIGATGFFEMRVSHLNVLTEQGELDNTLPGIHVNVLFDRRKMRQ